MQLVSLPTAILCTPVSHFLCPARHTVHSLFVVWMRQSPASPPTLHPLLSVPLLRGYVSPKHPHHHLPPPGHLSFSRLIFLLALNHLPTFQSVVPTPLPLALKCLCNLGQGQGEGEVGWRPSRSSNFLDLLFLTFSFPPRQSSRENCVHLPHSLPSHPLLFIIWIHSFLNS